MFKVGDEVVCVSRGAHPDWSKFEFGLTYTVSAVYPPNQNESLWGIDIEEVDFGDCVEMRDGRVVAVEVGWDARRFRKVQRRNLTEWLKTAVKDTDHIDERAKETA